MGVTNLGWLNTIFSGSFLRNTAIGVEALSQW